MSNPEMIKQILTEARSHKFFSDKPVTKAELKTLYDLAKMAPSASSISQNAEISCNVTVRASV